MTSPNADSGALIQAAETGVIHALDPEASNFGTLCGRHLEWGFYAIGEKVPVTGRCPVCMPPNGRSGA
jgi:hypothetical protein